jgi:uncharacterized protein YbgA (DUF1722 family)/uncharacterized protein YbbK (DUF523 family)
MGTFSQPTVIVSKCLEFERCRYNGEVIHSDIVRQLKPLVTFIPVCPEMEIGLGVPRQSIRIISQDDELKLVQPATGRDVTSPMTTFADTFLTDHLDIDGVILKNRSPSCGIKDVKIYHGDTKSAKSSTNPGFFGGAVLTRFHNLAIEDEGRLRNPRIRDHFLTKLYTITDFRSLKTAHNIRDLITFHTNNKFLFMGYNQTEMRALGRIVASHTPSTVKKTFEDYEIHLARLLAKPPRCTANINVLMHGLGFVTKQLEAGEKAFFLEILENYRAGRVPLSVASHVLGSWMVRFNEEYLTQQTFFHPYPQELMDIESVNACAARDFWK